MYYDHDADKEESRRVLDLHHTKNKPTKPPPVPAKVSHACSESHNSSLPPAGQSRVHGHSKSSHITNCHEAATGSGSRNSSHRPQATDQSRNSSHHPQAADQSRNSSHHPQAADKSRVHSHHLSLAPHITNSEAESNSGHEGDESDHIGKKIKRAPCNSKSQGDHDAKPSQLSFYSGTWVDILIAARNNYRKIIHTIEPFPEHNPNNLKEAQNLLLEAIDDFKDQGCKLDESSFILFVFDAC